MKFLNLVPWTRRSAQLDPAVARTSTSTNSVPAVTCTEPAVPAGTDTTAVCNNPTERKRRRSSGQCKTWRPSLDAISENAALRAAPAAASGKEGEGKRGGKKAKAKRVTLYTGCDDLRHFGSSAMMPSFSPTAFLF